MKITSIEYIPETESTEIVRIIRDYIFSKDYRCIVNSNRYKRIGIILSLMKENTLLDFSIDFEIGNMSHVSIFIGR